MEETSEQDASRGLPEMRCSLHDCIKVSEDSARIYSDTNGNRLTELSFKLVFDSDNDPRRVNIVQIWILKFLFYVSRTRYDRMQKRGTLSTSRIPCNLVGIDKPPRAL
jgi:hypothetical protein